MTTEQIEDIKNGLIVAAELKQHQMDKRFTDGYITGIKEFADVLKRHPSFTK